MSKNPKGTGPTTRSGFKPKAGPKSNPTHHKKAVAVTLRELEEAVWDFEAEEAKQQRILKFNEELVEKATRWLDWSRLDEVATMATKYFLEAYGSVRKDELDEIGERRMVYADNACFVRLQNEHGPDWMKAHRRSVGHGVKMAKLAINRNYSVPVRA